MKHVEAPVSAPVPHEPQASRRWLTIVLALAIGVCSFAIVGTQKDPALEPPSAPLLQSKVATCSHPRVLAREVGRQREQTAVLRWERAALEPAAALAAQGDMEMAAACYRAAGEVAAGGRAAAIALQYSRAIERERRHQQLRLQIATGRGDHAGAFQSVVALRALLHDKGDGPYVRWLAGLQREIEAKGSSR